MIHSIILENFLAHKKTEIRLGPGMTVLSGPNNSGKSAVVEGLRCVAQNPTPRHFIRHGAKEARVTVEVEDGIKITWIRKKATVIYEVLRPGKDEPEIYRKLRKGQVPEEVLELLRLDQVELESGSKKSDKKVDVHIGNQRTPIFLLADDGADARMAEFFASSTEGAHLLSMQKLLKNRIRESKMAGSALEGRMRDLGADMDKLAPLPGIERILSEVSELESELAVRERAAAQLERTIAEQRRLESEQRVLAARGQALAQLSPPPAVHDAASLAGLAGRMASMGKAVRSGKARLTVLDSLTGPPDALTTMALVEIINDHNSLALQMKQLQFRQESMRDLQEPPMLHEQQPLAGLLLDMQEAGARLERLTKVREAKETALARHEEAMQQRVAEIGSCPLCGNLLSGGTLLGGQS